MNAFSRMVFRLVLVFFLIGLKPESLPGVTDILKLQPVPVPMAPPVPHGNIFHGGGTVQRIDKDARGRKLFVIDDRLLYFCSGAAFYSEDGTKVSGSTISEGDFVGYLLNKKKEITRLYRVPR